MLASATAPAAAFFLLAVGLAAAPASAGEPSARGDSGAPRVEVVVLPKATTTSQLATVDGAAIGLLGAGIGGVPASQTYLDISQGTRTNPPLYDGDPPHLRFEPAGTVPQPQWDEAVKRAEDAPAELVPGLLASTLQAAGIDARAEDSAGPASTIAVDQNGELDSSPCDGCAGLLVSSGSLADARAAAASLDPGDLLIAFAKPPPVYQHELPVAIAGLGEGELVSDSTRLDGLVLSIDLAPTILDALGADVPKQMAGQPIKAEGEADPASLDDLDARLSQIKPRRGATVGANIVIWLGLTLVAGLGFLLAGRGDRGFRAALPLFALSVVYMPLLLLATAAIEPSALGERLIVGIGAPALGLLTRVLLPRWRALAAAAALVTVAYAIDVIAGSPLSRLSIAGPNPSIGVRFFGIGNELEAVLTALTLIGTGAALSGWATGASRRGIAIALAAVAFISVAAFAPGRFGADVGIAIGLPAGAAVAVVIALEAGRKRALLILAAPVAAVAAIALADLVLGGGAHLTRSVLQAGGLDGLADVAERRLRLGARTFTTYGTSPVFIVDAILIVGGAIKWRTVRSWFDGSAAAWAGFAGAAAATLVATLANDSGAYLLMIGSSLTSACAGYAWATRPRP
jgi:hypothetical protein